MRRGVQQVGDHGCEADDHSNHSDEVHEVLDLDLQGRLRASRLDAGGDLAQEGLVADEEHQCCRIALDHRGAVEGQIPCMRWRRLFLARRGIARLRDGLAGQRRVVDFHAVGAPQDADVGGDAVAGLERDDVAGQQVLGIEHQLPALVLGAPDRWHRRRSLHVGERIHETLRLQLCPPLQEARRDHHGGQDDGRHEVVAVAGVDEGALDQHGAPEEYVEDAGEDLLHQAHPNVLLLRRRDLVLAAHLPQCGRLGDLDASRSLPARRPVRAQLRVLACHEHLEVRGVRARVVVAVVRVLAGLVEHDLPLAHFLGLCDDHGRRAPGLAVLRSHRQGGSLGSLRLRVRLLLFVFLGHLALGLVLHAHLAGLADAHAFVVVGDIRHRALRGGGGLGFLELTGHDDCFCDCDRGWGLSRAKLVRPA
mmetsp:Transcript_29795/g.77262  ORF Transcript_29795/g.77262 Transcript_29795/m.77262 type:complete len:421 (+) Transcript_29795:1173-2435(+)